MKRHMFATVASIALAVPMSLGVAATASAAPAATAVSASVGSTLVKATLAPTCVKETKTGHSWGFPYAIIKNTCSTTQRVKIIWAFAPDSPCKTLKPGATYRDSTGALGEFDGIKKC